ESSKNCGTRGSSFSGTSQVNFQPIGINTTGQYSICAVDMNGDYLDDIVSVNTTNIQIHFQNSDGSFTEQNFPVTDVENAPSWSLAAGDLTGNGYNDLLYGGGSGVTFMMANNDGTGYTQTSFPEFVFSQRSNFVDINNDGNLDAFVCHDVAPNVYFINDGDGNLSFNQGGIGDFPTGGHYGSLWFDYNNDGLQDMFMAKCGGSVDRRTNQLFKNNGDGSFSDVAVEAGLNDPIQTWSAAGDFDNDGFMDLLVGASSFTDGGHKLMRNNGDGTFTDITSGSGFDTFEGTSVEHATYDFNNDGFLDVFGNSNKLFINNGDFTFTEVSIPFSGASIADLNNDGFLDAFRATTIYYNQGNENNWIVINTEGIESNKNGIGARVEITSALGTQIRDVRSGEGFRYMSTLNTHFGIGTDTAIEELKIKWPSGIIDVIQNPEINTVHHIVEGQYLSTNEMNEITFTIYPVPTKDFLNIDLTHSHDEVDFTIYDISGRNIKQGKLQSNTLRVEQLSSGVYFLEIQMNGVVAIKRFVKQ
ncbi:FG-GAP-like repeat-containing protein, partial [uncultured Planktosalinus sp.]|uniref:FG-GAP-like repeat-containing protein n=1 Tax=uncultured Planktosalinus sp. TaxID=1810935 RepID=UPI0030D7936F